MAEIDVPQQPPLGSDTIPDTGVPEKCSLGVRISGLDSSKPNEDFEFPPSPSLTSPAALQPRMSPGPDTAVPGHIGYRSRPNNLSLSALPPFEFRGAPATHSTVNPLPSPSRSPAGLTPPSSHATGHRRGGSEFIGGDIAHGGPVLLSTSPTTGEHAAPVPPSPPKGPPASRRGHAHRRSGAVSQGDIKKIMQPTNMQQAGSAPSTPSDALFKPSLPCGPGRSVSHPEPTVPPVGDGPRPSAQPPQSAPNQNRSRVGFSDSLEYIPRPLSTISSETSSSMSTVRANHSVTDSISSIVSGGTPSPSPSKRVTNRQALNADEYLRARDALESGLVTTGKEDCAVFQPNINRSMDSTSASSACTEMIPYVAPNDQISELPSQRDAPMRGFASATPTIKMPLSDAYYRPEEGSEALCNRELPPSSSAPYTRSQSDDAKVTKRQHRVKSWAGSILHRKGKHEQGDLEPVSHCTPPSPRDFPAVSDFSLEDVTFDTDTTCILEEPTVHAPVPPPLQGDVRSRATRHSSLMMDKDAATMIDLDAAFGSPSILGSAPTFEDYMGNSSNGKRRLHSSGETGGFMGPGMHYHRRTESAPEMEAFDRAPHGFPRLGSNPAMSEAIVEEEEDTDHVTKRGDHQMVGLGVNVVESDVGNDAPIRRRSGLRRDIQRTCTPPTPGTLKPRAMGEAEQEPRFSVLTKSSEGSTITPSLSRDPLAPRPASAPIDFALATPSLTFRTTPETVSAVSSADYSKTSFDCTDIPRMHTANSSITDRTTLSSSKVGNQSAGSVDDVPSLTDSTSTVFTGRPARVSSSGNTTFSADWSPSLSAAVPVWTRPGNSSKRASLASLTKLMGGPYNKSKLNIAETLPPDNPPKPDKKRRSRITRMMRFWQSNEKLSAK
ncbi:MAG: hypothetical protein Q9163_004017 [Psora crenata]